MTKDLSGSIEHLHYCHRLSFFRPCCGMTMEYAGVQASNLRSLKFTGVSEDVQRTLREFLPPLLAACSDSLASLCLDLQVNDKGTSNYGTRRKKLTFEIRREFKQTINPFKATAGFAFGLSSLTLSISNTSRFTEQRIGKKLYLSKVLWSSSRLRHLRRNKCTSI